MEEIAAFLPKGHALGEQLRGNASIFKTQLAASVAASVIKANSGGFKHPLLLPPFARARGEFAVFRNMTTDVRPPIERHDLASCESVASVYWYTRQALSHCCRLFTDPYRFKFSFFC